MRGKMPAEILLKGGTLVTASETREGDLLVRGGKIVEIGQGLQTTGQVLDVTDHLVMPGGIDSHVHLSHPIDKLGIKTADDFFTGTIAAACGGVTTIIDFALQRQGDSLAETLESRVGEVRDEAVIDYSLHPIVTDVRAETLAEIPSLIGEGFPSFKVMMTYAGKRVNDTGLLNVLEATSQHGGIVYLHCENDAAVTHLIDRYSKRGDTAPHFHELSRPALVEAEATYRAICLAELMGASICIAHVTNAGAASHIRNARERGLPVVAETCPQYLTLTKEVFDPSRGFESAKFVCSPPMRGEEHREALWDALKEGGLQQVASDHAPFRFSDQKTLGRGDFTRIPNGLPGIETRLPLVFTNGVKAGRIDVNRFVELVSTNPAKIFGMYPEKGSLDIGTDADLNVTDPNREVEVDHEILHSAMDYSPYEGMRLAGFPTWTMSRGDIIVGQGEPQGDRGRGQLVQRSPLAPEALP
jgi:dihydropyrimidinase